MGISHRRANRFFFFFRQEVYNSNEREIVKPQSLTNKLLSLRQSQRKRN